MLRRLILLLLTVQAELLALHFGAATHVAPAALVMAEGFDFWAVAQKAARGWTGGSGELTSMQPGRFSPGQAADFSRGISVGTHTTWKLLPSTYTTVIVGVAIRFNSGTQTFNLLTTAAGNVVSLSMNASNQIQVNTASGVIGTLTLPTTPNTAFNYYEIKVFVNGASSTVEVHVNGAVDLASTVTNCGTTPVGAIGITIDGSSSIFLDDIYVCDTTGTANNTFLGDIRVETLWPTSDGAHTQWTPDAGVTHYTEVDDTTPDGDTTFVSDTTVGDRDSYGFGDLAELTGTIFGVQRNIYARKDNTATKQICGVTRPGTTDHDGATVTLASSYGYFSEILETNPDTAAAWTISEVNATEHGVKVVT